MAGAEKYTVLLVEDDANDVLFMQRAFQRANSQISLMIIKDGDAAVEYLMGEGDFHDRDRYPIPALILLDLKLPRRSGMEVLRWVRQQSVLRRIPIVVLTSSRERIDIDDAYDLGVNSYLVKPVNFETLSNMVSAINAYWIQLNEYPSIVFAD